VPHEQESLPADVYPRGMNEAGLAVGKRPHQENLIGWKQGQRMQAALTKQRIAVVVDPPPRMSLVKYGRTVNGFIAPPGPYAQVDPGPVLAVDRPGRSAVNLLTHIVPIEFR